MFFYIRYRLINAFFYFKGIIPSTTKNSSVAFISIFPFCSFIRSCTLPILSSLNLLILLALTIFILPQTKAESDGYRSIMYRIADK